MPSKRQVPFSVSLASDVITGAIGLAASLHRRRCCMSCAGRIIKSCCCRTSCATALSARHSLIGKPWGQAVNQQKRHPAASTAAPRPCAQQQAHYMVMVTSLKASSIQLCRKHSGGCMYDGHESYCLNRATVCMTSCLAQHLLNVLMSSMPGYMSRANLGKQASLCYHANF